MTARWPSAKRDLALIERTMKEVEKSYVEPVKPGELTTGALKGMLTRLDPHSDYMDESEFRELMATTSGQFGGVGIEISVDDGVPQVISAIEGTPAAAAGLNPGDRIIKADGQPIVGMDIEEVVRKLRGAPGTPVTLTIARSRPAAVRRQDHPRDHQGRIRSSRRSSRAASAMSGSAPSTRTPPPSCAPRSPGCASRRAAASAASSSICATMPAACSTRRSRRRPISSIPARW